MQTQLYHTQKIWTVNMFYVSYFLNFSTLLHFLEDNLKSLIFHIKETWIHDNKTFLKNSITHINNLLFKTWRTSVETQETNLKSKKNWRLQKISARHKLGKDGDKEGEKNREEMRKLQKFDLIFSFINFI